MIKNNFAFHYSKVLSTICFIMFLHRKSSEFWILKRTQKSLNVILVGIPNVCDNRIRVCVLVKKLSCSLQQVVSLLEVALCNTYIQIFWNLHKPLRQLRFRTEVICIFKCYTEQMKNSVTLCQVCRCHLRGLCSRKQFTKQQMG